ncbi:hypothetical protein D805_1364 [Bifidobacterium thermophilum RBL67]|uniref:Uncharacterized protein n=1 Tax=Bifidobacterium thermophilum RBL67 TaxID=1254439 RepID=M4RDM6_9BIFI|nr:hypothetical protein D805_1364 [Bifidobacterium thermophilum RBL67]
MNGYMNSARTIVNYVQLMWHSARVANRLGGVATAATASDEQ